MTVELVEVKLFILQTWMQIYFLKYSHVLQVLEKPVIEALQRQKKTIS